MIVLDASVVIAHLRASDAHHDRASALLADHVDDELAISTITLAEVLVAPARTGWLGRTAGILKRLRIEEVPLPMRAAQRLAELRVETRLRLPDCCVLLTAREHDAAIATFDARLAAAARDVGVGVVQA